MPSNTPEKIIMQLDGWILDLYPCPEGMTLWLLTGNQTRHRLIDAFSPSFYVHGTELQLHRLEQALATQTGVTSRFTERTNLWENRAISVLKVSVQDPTQFRSRTYWVRRFDDALSLFDSDLMLASVYCWQRRVFPLAHVEVETDEAGCVRELECRDDEWAIGYELPPLEVMHLRLGGHSRIDPQHGRRAALEIEVDGREYELNESDEPAAVTFQHMLKRHDPDLILTEYGDSTILPRLGQQAARLRLPLALNRDPDAEIQQSRARSFMSYGRILFKDSSTTLFGRLHIDSANSFIADKSELAGLWELARVTKLPAQYAARTTPGTGISYMQMGLAYQDGVLIPAQKAEPEDLKSPDELLCADRGGLVFTPTIGFHTNVAELDFVSEYPSIMAKFNISPETVNCPCCPEAPRVPELGYRVCQKRRGITSRVVERLIVKKTELKRCQRGVPAATAQRYKLQRESLKWLLVCCFGYTGYKNARFGKIEAHEAINAVARETLLVAKEIAESRGYELLHALVDSLYVRKPDATPEDYEDLLQVIEERTGLPLAIEAIYRYVVFLPSKRHASVPVPNRFFAVSENGELKVRGLESRRHDTPPLVAQMQREALAILAEAHDYDSYLKKLVDARAVLRRYEERLADGSVAIEDLIVSKRITRSPREYQNAGSTAIAAQQLYGGGVKLRPGQSIEYVITDSQSKVPNDRVRAYALWEGWHGYDRKKYHAMLLEAFEPFEKFLFDRDLFSHFA
jgi:DNA polymerase II